MLFYHVARVDGLVKREETPSEMTEEYDNRDDFLYYKYVEFGKRAKKFGPQETSSANKGRPINVILIRSLEIFYRLILYTELSFFELLFTEIVKSI